MAPKKKGGKNKKKKGKNKKKKRATAGGGGGAQGFSEGLLSAAARWPVQTSVSPRYTAPGCTCFESILNSKGRYKPNRCALHGRLEFDGKRPSPRGKTESALQQLSKLAVTDIDAAAPTSKTMISSFMCEEMASQYSQIIARHAAGLQENFSSDDLAETHVRRATLLSLLGRHKEALADSSASIDMRPTYAPAYFRCGHALFSLGQYEGAAEVLRKGIRYSPGNPQLQHAFRAAVMENNAKTKVNQKIASSPPRKAKHAEMLKTRLPPTAASISGDGTVSLPQL